jgi:hypothetical protein
MVVAFTVELYRPHSPDTRPDADVSGERVCGGD